MIYPGSQYFCWYQIFIFPQKFQHIFAYIFSPSAWQYHSSQKQNTQVHKIQDTYLTSWYNITFCSETTGAFCWCPLFFPKSISKYHVEFIQILNTEQFTPLLTLKHYSKLDIQNHHHESKNLDRNEKMCSKLDYWIRIVTTTISYHLRFTKSLTPDDLREEAVSLFILFWKKNMWALVMDSFMTGASVI